MHHFKTFPLALLLSATCPVGLVAQFIPVSAHTNLYFPHLADGGTAAQQWQTTLTFVNPNTDAATALLSIYGNDGRPMAIDFGSGPVSSLSFTVPGGGTTQYRSTVASATIQTGWAFASATLPLEAVLKFQEIVNGVAKVALSTEPTLPSFKYYSPATYSTGVAIANVFDVDSVSLNIQVNDTNGNPLGQKTLTIASNNHTAFNLWQLFPSLAQDFQGSLILSGVTSTDIFVAWTLNSDSSGTLSTLPPGRIGWPISHWDQTWLVFWKIWDATQRLGQYAPTLANFGSTPPQLKISQDAQINAFASGGNMLQINLALSELISDSPSELAFAVAHEMGHIYQQRNGGTQRFNTDIEFDADEWGAILTLVAGYDPYAGAGTLAKLAMATGTAGLTTQFEAQLATDAHKSFNTRLDNMFNMLVTLCNDVPTFCSEYKGVFHPHFPSTAPLSAPRPVNRIERKPE